MVGRHSVEHGGGRGKNTLKKRAASKHHCWTGCIGLRVCHRHGEVTVILT